MPKITEVVVNVSLGGKVQVVPYTLGQDYHFSLSERWNVEDMTAEEAEQFRNGRREALQEELTRLGQAEFEQLWDQRERFAND